MLFRSVGENFMNCEVCGPIYLKKSMRENVKKNKENDVFYGIDVTLSSPRRYLMVRIGIKLVLFDCTGIIPYNKPNQTFTSDIYIFQAFWAI